MTNPATISAVVPARNEEAAIAACVQGLAGQPEVTEIIVVDDQSTDRTADILLDLKRTVPKLQVVATQGPPAGWVGKNNAVAIGAALAKSSWVLFTDADAVVLEGGVAKALAEAEKQNAVLVSYSPEQQLETWYEKSLIPIVYCRLAKRFSFDDINDVESPAAAANGQFLLIRRDVYNAVGGHAAIAGEVLEDVALAHIVKSAGNRIWFGSGKGIVRTRMYRSFAAMWEGWRKNLYRLMGGTPLHTIKEIESTLPWIVLLLLVIGFWHPFVFFLGVCLLLMRQTIYGLDLVRNQFRFSLIFYYIPAVCLYAGAIWASYRSHASGRVEWKGREYPVSLPGASR